MKFKIKRFALEYALSLFKKEDHECTEIELEPVIETATQAIYEQNIKNKAYEQNIKNKAFEEGLKYGYRKGFHERRSCYKNSCCNCCQNKLK